MTKALFEYRKQTLELLAKLEEGYTYVEFQESKGSQRSDEAPPPRTAYWGRRIAGRQLSLRRGAGPTDGLADVHAAGSSSSVSASASDRY